MQPAGAIHHIDITVSDLLEASRFYERIIPLLGFRRMPDCAEGPLWAGAQLELGLQAARPGSHRAHDRFSPGLHHLAFSAPSREAVDALHRDLVRMQVAILDAPADYPEYAPGHYAVFFADPAGLLILDVSAPAAPVELGRSPTPGIASAVEVVGSIAYLVDDGSNLSSAGVRILDVSTPSSPSEVGSLVGFSSLHDGDVQLPLAFGVSAYGFGIADVSAPSAPELRVVLPIATSAVRAVGNLAYVASGFFDGEGGPALRIYDVSDPAKPRLVKNVQTCKGSDTHTIVPHAMNRNILYIYV